MGYHILAERWKPYLLELERFLDEPREPAIFPPRDEIFTAFRYTPYDVVLLSDGDPYHEKRTSSRYGFLR